MSIHTSSHTLTSCHAFSDDIMCFFAGWWLWSERALSSRRLSIIVDSFFWKGVGWTDLNVKSWKVSGSFLNHHVQFMSIERSLITINSCPWNSSLESFLSHAPIIGDSTDPLAGGFATTAPAPVDLQEPARPPLPARAREDPWCTEQHGTAKLRQDGEESKIKIRYIIYIGTLPYMMSI